MVKQRKQIFISAGDPSGDIHAANLMRELLSLDNNLKFVGIGGPKMQELGLTPIVNFSEINVVGFWEVAKKYRFFKHLEAKSKNIIQDSNIDLVILIDYPGLNMRLADYAKSINKKVCYYIAPQLWAWGKKRAKKLSNSVDKLLVAFPFEEEFFKQFDMDVQFVGHPSLDLEVFELDDNSTRIDNQVCLIPGSRSQEVKSHLLLFDDIIRKTQGKYKFALSKSPSVDPRVYESFINTNPDVIIYENSRDAMKSSIFGIVKTGTSTLEATLLNLPFIMIYKTSITTYLIGRFLVNIEYLAMPNILLNKQVVSELIQQDATATKIVKELDRFMNNSDLLDKIRKDFVEIRYKLGKLSASKTASSIIYKEFLDENTY
ncbi:MAG: lipid-A-disaccharide synthase [Candidatus Kapaibacterium sp.]|nr:lipid-A-disaccharide synthase [Ignavibacteriota bacterium]MCB9220951.1 lipid-A-disaccharide synthase [Ignavibacteria bacterium]